MSLEDRRRRYLSREALEDTLTASRGALARSDSRLVFLAVSVVYLAGFLFALGDIAVRPGLGGSLVVVDDPLARAFEPSPGFFSYEAIALVDLWIVRVLVSPVNLLVGASLGVLVGINLALSYLAVTQPRACGLGSGSGVLASLPALLAGSSCCAPVVFVVVGVQASGILLGVFAWLLPVGVVLLFGSLVYVAGTIDPTALDATG